MSINTRRMAATPEQTWEVLADGWLYPLWVVGATRMREVDEGWPGVGTRLHHSVGTWPFTFDDDTEVLEVQAGSMLRLRARTWPAGSAEVVIRLGAAGAETDVSIEEDVVHGPARLVPSPFRNLGMKARNVETLQRLAYVVENRP